MPNAALPAWCIALNVLVDFSMWEEQKGDLKADLWCYTENPNYPVAFHYNQEQVSLPWKLLPLKWIPNHIRSADRLNTSNKKQSPGVNDDANSLQFSNIISVLILSPVQKQTKKLYNINIQCPVAMIHIYSVIILSGEFIYADLFPIRDSFDLQ